MEKKPLNIVVKNAQEAAKRLNEVVEKGGSKFDFGINEEYITTVTKNSNGSTSTEKEKCFRLVGFVDTCVGEELDSLNAVRDDLKRVKKERVELNRTLNVMNKSAFAPLSILLLGIAVVTLTLGILTLASVLPLPSGQTPIAIVLTIVGALSLGGSITTFIFRRKKKLALLSRKDEILKSDEELKEREKDVDSRLPEWYRNALWTYEGNTFRNAMQSHTLKM